MQRSSMKRAGQNSAIANPDGNKGWLHEPTVAIVIIGIQTQPEKHSQKGQNAGRQEQLRHGTVTGLITIAAILGVAVAKAARGSAEPLARIAGHTGLKLTAQAVVIEFAADQDLRGPFQSVSSMEKRLPAR
jgi:hypothetical protein